MPQWLNSLKYNPIPPLLESKNKAILLFAERDLLNKKVSLEPLQQLKEPQSILRKQKEDGSWQYPGANERVRSQENYNQLETYRNLGILIEKYGFDRKYPAVAKAAEYLFTFQTKEGDFRGIYGNQYSPNYSSGILELLIKAGYENDSRVKKHSPGYCQFAKAMAVGQFPFGPVTLILR